MRLLFVVLTHLTTIGLMTCSAQTTGAASGFPSKVEITQHSDAHDGGMVAAILDKVSWPVTVTLLVLVFQKPIRAAVEQIGRQGGEITVAGLGLNRTFAVGQI